MIFCRTKKNNVAGANIGKRMKKLLYLPKQIKYHTNDSVLATVD